MLNEEFEWDDHKAEQNWRKHGVDFHWALAVFRDVCAIEWIDARFDYGEERVVRLALCEGILISAVYTEIEDRIRLISARRATKNEQDIYFRENGQE